tara:strand:- start:1147 stop:2235 length:1089 start_codon:yes stop_codon:yes gene_type:complete
MLKNVLVVGTGTIGEPLIGLLSDFKDELGIRVFFHKRTPLLNERAKVNSLVKRGANLVVDQEKQDAFRNLNHDPATTSGLAFDLADVIIDCTPAGNENKENIYEALNNQRYCATKGKRKTFIAQGSEKGFGLPYAFGINDTALAKNETNFVQVVSCNTHNICSLVKTLSGGDVDKNFISGDFTCIRRANDISQNGSFIASPEVGKHGDNIFGTHHAKDAHDLFGTLDFKPNLFSSALKINSQYMHLIRFNISLKGYALESDVIKLFSENKHIALTHKTLTNKVFSFGRDHGYYGRIFNHTVIARDSLNISRSHGNTIVTGFCFTPQDGNSLLSSVAATLHGTHGEGYLTKMEVFDQFLFDEI